MLAWTKAPPTCIRREECAMLKADAPFQLEGDHAGSAAHVALGNWPGACAIQRCPHLLLPNMESRDVIQVRV